MTPKSNALASRVIREMLRLWFAAQRGERPDLKEVRALYTGLCAMAEMEKTHAKTEARKG